MTILSELVNSGKTFNLYSNLATTTETTLSVATTLTSTAFGKNHIITGGADYTVTLPAASGNSGNIIGVRITGSALFTIKGNGAELIDGENERVMWKDESAVLLCDGSGWTKVAGKSIPFFGKLTQSTSNPQSVPHSVRVIFIADSVSANVNGAMSLTGSIFKVPRKSNYKLTSECTFNCSTDIVLLNGFALNGDILYRVGTPFRQRGVLLSRAGGVQILEDNFNLNDEIQLTLLQLSNTTVTTEGFSGLTENYFSVTEIPTW